MVVRVKASGETRLTRREIASTMGLWNTLSSAGASVLAIAYVFPVFYLLWSLKYGAIAGPNPWNATGLEWQTSSPPPTENFHEVPVVTEEAYQYY